MAVPEIDMLGASVIHTPLKCPDYPGYDSFAPRVPGVCPATRCSP